MAAKGARLTEGRYRHPRCPECDELPHQIQRLTPTVRWILRRRWCRGDLVDFALLLQTHTPSDQWVDVTRFSVAHANAHQYIHYRDSTLVQVKTAGPINDVAEVQQTYENALRLAYPGTERFLKMWEEGP